MNATTNKADLRPDTVAVTTGTMAHPIVVCIADLRAGDDVLGQFDVDELEPGEACARCSIVVGSVEEVDG